MRVGRVMGNCATGGANSQQATALFVSAFFDELARWGVREAVISPGSRSTALATTAFEMSRRFPDRMNIYMDVDERGASFFALGLAKASGRPVALICTSGTALANYYPAVMEAETSRVPLLVLSGDRPLRLQGVGAPQTVDQMKAYGDHVRGFRQMIMPGAAPEDIAFARQAAREACLLALGPGASVPTDGVVYGSAAGEGISCETDGISRFGEPDGANEPNGFDGVFSADGAVVASRGCRYMAGPVQVNFQLDEPLTPDLSVEGLFEVGRGPWERAPWIGVRQGLDEVSARQMLDILRGRRVLVLAGEGSCETEDEACEVIAWASWLGLPLLADPLSGLRGFADDVVMDNYDNVFGSEDCPLPDVVVRFGRYPISKRCAQRLAAARPFNVVVDVAQMRDFNLATDMFVACTPLAFVRSMMDVAGDVGGSAAAAAADGGAGRDAAQRAFLQEWVALNERARACICAVSQDGVQLQGNEATQDNGAARGNDTAQGVAQLQADAALQDVVPAVAEVSREVEGAYVQALLDLIPEKSCLFSANSMSIRALDTFYVKSDKRLAMLCNRGQNGIDGTVSTALGAAQHFRQTTFLTGDFTMLHDLNALVLQRELRVHHGGDKACGVVIVLLNNNGGGIFDMLPQKSEDAYFERLFLAPQDVRFADAARAFDVPYCAVETVDAFRRAYGAALGVPGISFIEVKLPLSGVTGRYAPYQAL